jgi:26S proteasome regulatory subunit N3
MTDNKSETAANEKSSVSTLETASRRLERLLSLSTNNGNSASAVSSTSAHTNPAKIVKRWLGTSSGVASPNTTKSLADISKAAKVLLDPNGPCATGRDLLLQLNPTNDESMEIDDAESSSTNYLVASSREVESWLLSLAIRLLWNNEKTDQAYELVKKALNILNTHLQEAEQSHSSLSPQSLYPLLARFYRYQSLLVERCGSDNGEEQRVEMAYAHRVAVLRRDVDTQATLLNLMLRELLNANQVEQAQKLLSSSNFPDTASNNQLCRYLYHSGLIQALRLEYTSAFSNLSTSLRKTPTNTGLGFRIAVTRLQIVVQLLMGEVPERSVFFTENMVGELKPYLKITQAVRKGDLAVFQETVGAYQERLELDGTFTLISRLAHSVVKAGLRKLNVSYSRISLEDIAQRLGLANETSAEFVVAKAVRDGVIDATIHHEERYVQSHDLVDIYATTEPTDAFHRRIAYCLTTHNDAVRGMRYTEDAYKRQLEASRGIKGKGKDDDKTDEEKAKELEEEMDDDY